MKPAMIPCGEKPSSDLKKSQSLNFIPCQSSSLNLGNQSFRQNAVHFERIRISLLWRDHGIVYNVVTLCDSPHNTWKTGVISVPVIGRLLFWFAFVNWTIIKTFQRQGKVPLLNERLNKLGLIISIHDLQIWKRLEEGLLTKGGRKALFWWRRLI